MRGNSGANPPAKRHRTGCGPLVIRVWVSALLIGLMSILIVESVAAQDAASSGVRVSFTAERTELTVGDVVILSLVIDHPTDVVVVVPRLEREWGAFEVQDQTSVQTISVEGEVRTIAKQFRVTLFETGDFETPAMPISVRGPDGSLEQIETAPVRLRVNSVLSGSDDELKDIRPPADFYGSFWDQPEILVFAGIIFVGAVGASSYYLLRRSRREKRGVVIPVDTRSPWEAATQEFDRIAALDLPEKGDFKAHYTLVAGVLRACLGATVLRADESAEMAEMSTVEIGMALRQSMLDTAIVPAVIRLLEEADLVKFANYSPPASRAYGFMGEARAMVESVRISLQGRTTGNVSEEGEGTW